MMSKNSKETMNTRTHNPFSTYKELHRNTTRHDRNPEDNVSEFAEEFDAKLKNKNNKTNHDKNQQSNKK